METLNRRRRTRILVLAGPELRQAWADEIRRNQPVTLLEPARAGLVMLPVRESARRSLFLAGEVLITEAKARVGGSTGLGLIRGWDEAAAEDLAVIDAASRAGLADEAAWRPRLDEAERVLESRRQLDRDRLAATVVEFQSLDQEAAP